MALSILTNKHVVVAMIVTPILAVLGYFAVDAAVSEKPHAAKPGQKYELAEKPNCRYTSGICGLKNGDFEINLTTEWRDDNRMLLVLKSAHALDGVIVALVENEADNKPPQKMNATDQDGLQWSLDMPRPDPENRLHLAVSSNKTLYYGDAAMKFTLYKTTFDDDFRQ